MKKNIILTVLIALASSVITNVKAESTTFSKDGIRYELLDNGTLKVLPDIYYDDEGIERSRYSGNIVIPDMIDEHMVMAIADRAFFRCQNLLSVKLPTHLQTIGSLAFAACSKLSSITIPANVREIGEEAFSFNHLKNIEVDKANTIYSSEDGILYDFNKSTLVTFPAEKDMDDYLYIKEGVETIGEYAFYGNGFLKDITIVLPSTLRHIGKDAFKSNGGHGEIGYYGYYKFVCRSTTPPTIDGNPEIYDLYHLELSSVSVPRSSIDSYKTHSCWGLMSVKPIPCIAAVNKERVYGEDNPEFDFTFDGEEALNGTPVISCEARKGTGVGEYVISIDYGSVVPKYLELTNGVLTINKATLQVSTKDYTIAKGEEIPTFEITYDGFKNGEDESFLTVKPSASTIATNGSPAGTYPIAISGGEADNYTFDYTNAELTITETGVSGIIEATANGTVMKKNSYTISGVSCGDTDKLGKGLYVIGGKKILVK